MALAPDAQRKRLGSGRGELLQPAAPAPAKHLASLLQDVQRNWKEQGSLAGLWQDWPRIAGPQLAPHCHPLSIQKGTLVIGASHPQWRQALQYNRPQLLAALRAAGHPIRDLRIQQHHPAKAPQMESEADLWAVHPSRIDVHGMANCPSCNSPSPAGEMARWGHCGFCQRQKLADQ
ncbi:MAG: DUF721 domain-containing protein [Prochlorococcus sp.]